MILNPIKNASKSIASVSNLCTALGITNAELVDAMALPHTERYQEKITPKKDGTDRVIHNPHYLIRKIQRRINDRIFSNKDVILWPSHVYGTIPNQIVDDVLIEKDYIACAKVHCEAKSILSLDIKDFFNNIHESIVKDIFVRFFHYEESVAEALTNICCSNNHVIQGALTSSYIASLCLYDIEGRYVTRLRNKGLNYTRLVDDITVSSKVNNYDFGFAISLITEMLAEKDLPVNLAKTKIQYITATPLAVHGLRVSFKEPRLPSDEVRKIRAAVKNTETLSKEKNYRTSHAYRRDFNRCMGRVNKLKRVGHNQHSALLKRLVKILPLPSKKDIKRARTIIDKLKKDFFSKSKDNYWYKKRFYLAHERLNILMRLYPDDAILMREELKGLRPEWS